MMTISELHNASMQIADEADSLKRIGKKQDAIDKYKDAFNKEREAAFMAIREDVGELSISVLLRSAACLAFDAELQRECEQVIGLALSRDLPSDIAEELRDLLENVNFARHLRLNGVSLDDNEIQIAVAGNGVAHGMAKKSDVDKRLDTIQQLTIRTLERKKGIDFRTKGRISRDVISQCQPYFSVPRAASFAISIRIGQKKEENQLEGFESRTSALIDDVVTNLKIANSGNFEELRQRIPDEKYLLNFISYAKEFAPDGDDVNLVGVTYMKDGEEVQVPLQRIQKEYETYEEQLAKEAIIRKKQQVKAPMELEKEEILQGTFSAADAIDQTFKISIGTDKYKVNVPDGLADIVRKYFDEVVSVRVWHNFANDEYSLMSISPIQTKLNVDD